MINKIYGNGKYFQKSKSFLYPTLGIKKNNLINPLDTYVSIEGIIDPDEMKLICVFKNEKTPAFSSFEKRMLLENPLFERVVEDGDKKIYIFDLSSYKIDWFNFLLGKYSKLTPLLKRAIKEYYGDKSPEWVYMETYLFPEKSFEIYSKILEIDQETLKSIGELCDPCDIEKETLKISKELFDKEKKTE